MFIPPVNDVIYFLQTIKSKGCAKETHLISLKNLTHLKKLSIQLVSFCGTQ